MPPFSHDAVLIQEIGPRDGLQIEPRWVETADKIALIDGLSAAGLRRIEAGSFVSPRAIPMLRDADEVFRGIRRASDCIYAALVPNLKGAMNAMAAGADEINLVVSASETHNLANMRMPSAASFVGFKDIAAAAAGTPTLLNGTIATAFGCPFEGPVAPERVLDFIASFLDLGMHGITLADTTGMANPRQVHDLVTQALTRTTPDRLTVHFHNTRGMGLANVLAAYQAGARRFDASLGGLGGCPYAPGATGNICTEDVVNMFHDMGIPTGLDLDRLIALSRTLPALLGHDVPGQVAKAGRAADLHPRPAALAQCQEHGLDAHGRP